MKGSIKRVLVVLTVLMSMTLVQNVWAETVTGVISEISTSPDIMVVDDTEIYGARYRYLCNQYNICLEVDDVVTVEYYEFTCTSGEVINKACIITNDDVTVELRDCP